MGDTAVIPAGATQPVITAGGTVTNLTLSGGASTLGVNSGQSLTIATQGGTSAISNAGTITLGPSGANNTALTITGDNGIVNLTGAGSLVMSGANASIGFTGSGLTLNNSSTIQGQGGINLGNFTNSGIVNANVNGGTLTMLFGGSNSGTLEATNNGTLVLFHSSIVTTGAGLISADNGTVNLQSNLGGATFSTANGGQILIDTGTTTLGGTTAVNGTLNVATTGVLNLADGTTLSIGAGGAVNIANGTKMTMAGDATLAGAGALVLNGNAQILGFSGTLTNNGTIQGSGLAGTPIHNNGVINANVNGATFFDATNINKGTLEATNGGNIGIATVDNTGGIIKADGAGSTATLQNTVTNGTLTATNGGKIVTVGGSGAQLAGTMVLNGTMSVGSNSNLVLNSGLNLTINGDLNVASGSGGLFVSGTNGTITLNGSGTLTLGGVGFNANSTGTGMTLNNNATIQGSGEIRVFDAINNTGVFHANDGGLMDINALFTNTGQILVDAGSSLADQNGFTQTAGSTEVEGSLTANSTGFHLQGGTFSGTGTLTGRLINTGGTVTPGDAPGTLHVSSYMQGPGGTLEIDILSNAIFGQLIASDSLTMQLDGILDFVALNGYTPSAHQFLIASVGAGSQVVLEKSLNVIFPTIAGWTFSLEQSPDNSSLFLDVAATTSSVPEPSSISLTAVAAGLFFLVRRRVLVSRNRS